MLDDDPIRIAALSRLVLQLHRGCRVWPSITFHDRACELLAELLPLDHLLWGAENPGTHSLVALHRYRVPDGLWAQTLSQGLGADPLLVAARATPATAVVVSLGPYIDNSDNSDNSDRRHGLAITQLEPLSKLRSFWCIWRGGGAQAFSASDQRLLQFVVPHLMETARESQLARVTDGAEAAPPRSHAVCDLQGALQHLDDRCQSLLRLEWPTWPGGVLPAPLLAVLKSTPSMRAGAPSAESSPTEAPLFVGRRIAARLTVSGHTVMLAVRLRAPCDKLSARQRSIAQLYASGSTGPEIAQRLGLAPSTVNNHLGEVFKKLQVNSKLQMALALKGAEA